jgi:glycerol-3-phosphate cytidylyltransferase-like family protein
MRNKKVFVSGVFDLLHSGHIIKKIKGDYIYER